MKIYQFERNLKAMKANFDTNLLITGFLEAIKEHVDSKTRRYVVDREGFETDVCDLLGTMLLIRSMPHTSTIRIGDDYYETSSFPILRCMKRLMNTAEIYLVNYSKDRAELLIKASFDSASFNPLSIEGYKFKPMNPRQIRRLIKDLKLDDGFLSVKDPFEPISLSDLNCVCEDGGSWYSLGGSLDIETSTLLGVTIPSDITKYLVDTYPASKEGIKKWFFEDNVLTKE